MAELNTIGVDLAKNVIQVSVLTPRGKELHNKALTRSKFREFLVKQQPALVAFEACATAHYWARTAKEFGHDVRIIPAMAVAAFRQGHKTDANDALAVAEAAGRPNIKSAPMKSLEQQGLQAIYPKDLHHFMHASRRFWKMPKMACHIFTDRHFS